MFGLMLFIAGINNAKAQTESINWGDYITDEMAQKLTRNLTNGLSPIEGGQIYELFMLANDITSLSDFADIMDNLTKHKDYAAKFILEVNSNFACPHCYFQSIVGFTWREIAMAKVAGSKMQDIINTKKERALIEKWDKQGKDTTTFTRGRVTHSTTHPKFVFYPQNGSGTDTVHKYPVKIGDWWPIYDRDINIPFIVGENGEISNDFREKIKQYGMDSICVRQPAERWFEKLDTTISVPSRNYFGVAMRRNEMHKSTTSYVATLKYDKKNREWIIKKCENNKARLKDWFGWIEAPKKWTPKETLGVDSYDAMLEWMSNYFNDTLNGYDGKMCKIEFTFIPYGKIRYYINSCLIGEYILYPSIQIDNIERK